jgi:hypothetical protein
MTPVIFETQAEARAAQQKVDTFVFLKVVKQQVLDSLTIVIASDFYLIMFGLRTQ